MTDNFLHTAKRMYQSSKTLHNNGEFHNACYIGGYVIECYGKIIVETFGINQNGRSFSHRLKSTQNKMGLSTAMQQILSGNNTLAKYILEGTTDFNNILNLWNPMDLRYSDTLNAISQQNISDDFQQEINLAMQRLATMEIDGII